MRRLPWRLLAVLLAAVCSTGLVRPCLGGQPTPAARMACCDAHGACPMRRHGGEHAGHPGRTPATQTEADACCRLSERSDSGPSTSAVLLLPSPVSRSIAAFERLAPAPALRPALDDAAPPGAAREVSRHVLLSVFLI